MKPIRDLVGRRTFARSHTRCWCCGHDGRQFGRQLEVHHIAKPGRCDSLANLSVLCGRCHRVVEGERVIGEDGEAVPKLSLEHVLWLKKQRDPKNYNRARIMHLRGRAWLPRALRPPQFYLDEYDRAIRPLRW